MKKHEAGHVRTAVSLHCMFSCKTHSLAVVGAKSVQLRISRVLTIVSEKKLACVSSAIEGNTSLVSFLIIIEVGLSCLTRV